MDKQLTILEGNNPPNNLQSQKPLTPSEHEMMVYHTMAEQAVASKMYKGIGEKAGVMMIMLSARELGIPPMQALNGGLNIINGKVEISARMMNALIRKAGHQIIVKESTDASCTLIGKRCDTGESITASFSLLDAQKAGLVKEKGGWRTFPKDMCFARALSRLARQLFSDVIGIGYVEGEIKAQEVEVVQKEDSFQKLFVDVTPEESEEILLQRYLCVFCENDHQKAIEYLQVVEHHFCWQRVEALKELLKDEKKLVDKFCAWINKQQGVL